jgi:hypothetical protein
MNLKNIKLKHLVVILILASAFYHITKSLIENYQLKKNGVFILGQFFNREASTKGSTLYSYKYTYKNKVYERNFRPFFGINIKKDSLMFFKIMPTNPELCRQLDDVKVPDCFTIENMPENGWKEFPTCPY